MKVNETWRRVLWGMLALVLAFNIGLLIGCGGNAQPEPEPEPVPEEQPEEQPERPTKIQVPNVVFIDEASATRAVENLGLRVGIVRHEKHDTVPSGKVIRQTPDPYKMVDAGTIVEVVVSNGKKTPNKVKMPNIVGRTQEEAEKILIDSHLVPVPGNPEYSDTVAPGLVCKQSVKDGEELNEGSQVTFSISLGKKTVKVPDVRGKKADDARDALKKLGLGVDSNTQYDDKVAEGYVISQSIPVDTSVTEGTTVTITVSLGAKPVEKVKVPDIMTYGLNDAVKAIESAGLKAAYSGDLGGTVNAMSPAAGTEVPVGSTVTFSLQHVVTLIPVPDVAGMDGVAARAAFDQVGLILDYNVHKPEDILIGTEPPAGTLVDVDTIVRAVYEDLPETVEVPDVAGLTGPAASEIIRKAGLLLDYDVRQPERILAGTDPEAGTVVEFGSYVCAVYEDLPTTVVVPDVSGMNGVAARDAMELAGLVLDYDVRQPDRILIGTEPPAGTEVESGSFVEAQYEEIPTTVVVPDVSGMKGIEANDTIEAAGLVLDYDVRQPDRELIGTEPPAGTEVEIGSYVEAQYEEYIEPVTGAWETVFEAASNVNDTELALFEQAEERMSQSGTAITVLATKEGEGTKGYSFLSIIEPGWAVISCEVDEEGNITYSSAAYLDPTNPYVNEGANYGGWNVVASGDGLRLSGEVKDAVSEAMRERLGAELKPLVVLAEQVTNGMNYKILGVSGAVAPGAEQRLSVATLYCPTSGTPEIVDMQTLDLSMYV